MEGTKLDEFSACASVYDAFALICERHGDAPFLAATSRLPQVGGDLRYADVSRLVREKAAALRAAGYEGGGRVALLLGNRPEYFIHMLACNALGISVVPINPDLSSSEMEYVLSHSEAMMLIYADAYRETAGTALALMEKRIPGVPLEGGAFPPSTVRAARDAVSRATEASLLYTSGTTGKPKGCMLSNEYYFHLGEFYAGRGGLVGLRAARERILNPLPVFHQNAGIFSFMGALLTGSCLVMTDRFHASTWWREVVESRATVIHYLGVMPAILLKLPPSDLETGHGVRFGVGAGVEPSQHGAFERRFGFPLLELWGMTETGGGFLIDSEPRQVGSRAVGRPGHMPGRDLQIRLVDDSGRDVPVGEPGELLVRRLGDDPRKGLFSGYLKDKQATEQAWEGGWFHTGDAFRKDETGMLYFVERKKNIVRRSGENIAAMEVEAVVLACPGVQRVAVIAVADDVRGEEVMACVEPVDGAPRGAAFAEQIFDWCRERLAYYKAPGWIVFLDSIPSTSTQKIQKTKIFPEGTDPRRHPECFDFRERKKRGVQPGTGERQ